MYAFFFKFNAFFIYLLGIFEIKIIRTYKSGKCLQYNSNDEGILLHLTFCLVILVIFTQ